ncbi:MAG: DUF3653 domain-containing protein [Pseudoxanthomonas sp.]
MQELPSPEEMAQRIHNLVVWQGWRMAGTVLVDPAGTRFTPERLRGMAWHQDASTRLNNAAARNAKKKPAQCVRVVIVDLADWQERHFGRRAG